MYFSGRAELTAGEMRDPGKRGPEAGGGAKGLEEGVVGFVHIFLFFFCFLGVRGICYRYNEKNTDKEMRERGN